MNSIIHLEDIRKSYFMGKNELPVLKAEPTAGQHLRVTGLLPYITN